MKTVKDQFTVFFEAPFWVGIYERISDGRLEVCKVTFGPEPKDYEISAYMLRNWNNLPFSSPEKINTRKDRKLNPKRMQREIKKQLETHGTGTRSQQALKLQYEEHKNIRRQKKRLQKEAEKQFQYELKQRKKKEKHRGH